MSEKMWIKFCLFFPTPPPLLSFLVPVLPSWSPSWTSQLVVLTHTTLEETSGAKTVDKTARRRTLTLPAAATSCSTSCKGENWFGSFDGILKSTSTWGGWRNSRGIWWSREPQLWLPSARFSLCCRPGCMFLVWRRREGLKQYSEQHHPPIDF